MSEFHFFLKGWESQWRRADMVIDGVTYNTCEQYMMAEKARLFGDATTLRKILTETSPRRQKELGREVTPFDKGKWEEMKPWKDGKMKPHAWQVVWKGNYAKFKQNPELLEKLLATTGELVECNPRDSIWGIALAEGDPKTLDKKTWRGSNWLGEILTDIRECLRQELAERGS